MSFWGLDHTKEIVEPDHYYYAAYFLIELIRLMISAYRQHCLVD